MNSGVELEGSDVLDALGRAVKVDDSLVDLHLKVVPGVGSLSARRLSGGDMELLSGDSDGSSSLEIIVLGVGNDGRAGLLNRTDLLSSDGESEELNIIRT